MTHAGSDIDIIDLDVDLDVDATPLDRDELQLVDRLWRSGTSATAVSPSARGDLGLLQRFLSLDDRAVVTPLLRRHRVATWRLAAAVTLDVDTAAVVVERAWREALTGSGQPIATCANPRAWLFEIVRRVGLEEGAAPGVELALDTDVSMFPLDQAGDVGLLAASFTVLDEVARTAVWLHAVEGFDDVDVAFVLGLRRLETHDLIDGAMSDLRVSALRAQLAAAPERCRPHLHHVAGYLDDELGPDDERDLLLHLSRCRRCAARLDALEAPGLSLVDRVLQPPADLTQRLRELVSAVGAGDPVG